MAKSKQTPDQRAASKAVSKLLSLNQPRHINKESGRIHSVSTARQYQQIYTRVSAYCRSNKERFKQLKPTTATAYLSSRSKEIQDKQLNIERRAIEIYLRDKAQDQTIKLHIPKSTIAPALKESRAYSPDQVRHLARQMNERLALSVKLKYTGGLRAHELYTLQRISDRKPSQHRTWDRNRYIGVQREKWVAYTVKGKGGLVREVRFPPHLAEQLEANRVEEKISIKDRGAWYQSDYDLIGGKILSEKFTEVSEKYLGYSNGAHGLRHSYAQERVFEIQNVGKTLEQAKAIVSQELGHFRVNITEEYLR